MSENTNDMPKIGGVTPTTAGFASNADGSVTAGTPGAVAMYHLLSMTHALALEINTGMAMHSGVSLIKQAKKLNLTSKQTKRGVLGDLVAAIKKVDPNYAPSASVTKALAK